MLWTWRAVDGMGCRQQLRIGWKPGGEETRDRQERQSAREKSPRGTTRNHIHIRITISILPQSTSSTHGFLSKTGDVPSFGCRTATIPTPSLLEAAFVKALLTSERGSDSLPLEKE